MNFQTQQNPPNSASSENLKMSNTEVNSEQISLFHSLIQSRQFDDGTLRVLDSVLISRDVKSLLDVRRRFREFMRRESVSVLREISQKSVDHRLLIVEFFVRAFAIIGDLESCLSLRYEGLVLREVNSVGDQQLHVSYSEWFTFAEHAFEHKFYAISRKACEKALACFQTNDMLKTKDPDALSEDMEAIRKIKRLKDIAMVKAASQSVQAQAVEYLKRKVTKHEEDSTHTTKEKRLSASIQYRNGIKKHNTRKLKELQRLKQIVI